MVNLVDGNWNAFQGQLKGFVLKRVKDKSVVDDIVQDVFVKVYTRLYQLKDTEKIQGWIYQIARNTITDYFRNNQKVIDANNFDWHDEPSQLNQCVENCVQQLIVTLPDKYREALQLSEIESMSQVELAEKLGISYSGAKSRVQRARQILKKKMEELLHVKTDGYGNVLVCEDRSPCDC